MKAPLCLRLRVWPNAYVMLDRGTLVLHVRGIAAQNYAILKSLRKDLWITEEAKEL